MLPFGVVRAGLNLSRRQDPVPDHVAPHRDPDEDVTAGGLDLLEIHPERLGRVRGQRLDVERRAGEK